MLRKSDGRTVVESLEPRTMLSAALNPAADTSFATYANGLLAVIGTSGNDRIRLSVVGGSIVARLNGIDSGPFARSGVSSIEVVGTDGNDRIKLRAGVPPVSVSAGTGADTVLASNADDTLVGGNSGDSIQAGSGNNLLKGGRNATLVGGTGNDTLRGVRGLDSLVGGRGDDLLVVRGHDVVVGSTGGGFDTIKCHRGHDSVAAGPLDSLVGINASDTVTGGGAPSLILGNNPASVQFAAGFRVGPQSGPNNDFGAFDFGHSDTGFFFAARTPAIAVTSTASGATLELQVDGKDAAQVTLPASGVSVTVTFPIALDAMSVHNYKVFTRRGTNTINIYMSLSTPGGLISSAIQPHRDRVLFIGDSITLGAVGQPDTQAGEVADFQRAAFSLANVTNYGQNGSTVTEIGARVAADIATYSIKPDRIVILWGTNDLGTGMSIPNFQAAYTSLLQSLVANTQATIDVLALLPHSGFSQSTIDSYDAAIQASVAASQLGGRIAYVDTAGWLSLPGDFQDGLHPTVGGWAKLAAHELAVVFPHAFFAAAHASLLDTD